jgi:hypothetical protein
VIFAPRQNLKTELMLARILVGLYLFGEELTVYSAHHARTTAKKFRRLKRANESSPQLGARIERVSNRAGSVCRIFSPIRQAANAGLFGSRCPWLDGDPPAGRVPIETDRHHELAAFGGTAGQRSEDFQQPRFDEGRLPHRVFCTAGMRPAVEDLGHVPDDAGLEMLDPPGLQAGAGCV